MHKPGDQKLGMVAATLLSFDTSLDIEKQAKQVKDIEGCQNNRECYTAQSACLQPQQFLSLDRPLCVVCDDPPLSHVSQ